ncbi:MAG: AraC family transcriptional regulator [Lachnospiraceae bacterium]|nr:AraC family transcriptional regulator [Lachnospiraceae bacterium]
MNKQSETQRNQFGIGNDKSQVFKYNNPEFPAYITHNSVGDNFRFSITDHWHDDIEFMLVVKGSMRYSVEGEIVRLMEGEAIMVNSRKLHVCLSDNGAAVETICVIMHPMLLATSKYVDETFIEPVIKNESFTYLILNPTRLWQYDVIEDIKKIHDVKDKKGGELLIIKYFFDIWNRIYNNVSLKEPDNTRNNHHLAILKDMISFIHEHYKEKISLVDICEAGGVGKTMGTNIFNMYVNKTPGEFLKDYRIQKSIYLLQETDMTITEICYETGFAGASYFAETFKKQMGINPLSFRKEKASHRAITHYDFL